MNLADFLLHRIHIVQECDATEAAQRFADGLTKKIRKIFFN